MDYPLLTERLSIQPLSLSDLESFLSYRQDPVIARFQSWEPSYSKAQALELLDSQAGVLLPKKDQWLQLAIHHRLSGELVGDLALHAIADDWSIFEIGFTLSRKSQGQGFAREAASGLMNYLVAQTGVTKFVANTDRRNAASISLLLALGFKRIPARTWEEHFKGEEVVIDYFETEDQAEKSNVSD